MPSKALVKELKTTAVVAPAVVTSTTLSSACDLQYFEGAVARFHCGTFGDTQSATVYIEAELQESDDNSTYTAVPNASLVFPGSGVARTGHAVGTFFQSKTTAAADTAGLYEVSYLGQKRYLKINVRLTGTHSNGTPVSASITVGNPVFAPAQ
jgi:hypothetical protein